MFNRISTGFCVLLLLFFSASFGQNVNADKLQRQILNHFDLEDYELAVPKLEKLIEAYPDSGLYHFQLGVAHWYSERKHTAHPNIKTAEELGFVHPRLDFYRARTEHSMHNFQEAIPYYEKYLGELSGDEKETPDDIKRFIQECTVGKELKANALHVEIEHLGAPINTKFPEYVPLVNADEDFLIFTTCRPENKGHHKDLYTELYFEDIYYSKKVDGKWVEPKSISDNINTTHHDANVALSADGKSLITFHGRGRFAHEGGDLLISHLEDNGDGIEEWSTPEPLPKTINSEYKEPSASFSANKHMLFFSSDRPGGYGGLDVYYCMVDENGKWGEAVNLGPQINSARDEDAPYIHPDGKTIFFSSTGHANIGGYDIFYAEFDSSAMVWGAPINIGYPINTAGDDIYFVWSSDAQRGYYSSYRADSYGDKDLYIIHRPNEAENQIIVKGVLTDAESGEPLYASIHVHEKESNEFVGAFDSDPETGKYALPLTQGHDYNMAVLQEEDTLMTTELHVPEKTAYFEITMDMTIVVLKEVVSEVVPANPIINKEVVEADNVEAIGHELANQINDAMVAAAQEKSASEELSEKPLNSSTAPQNSVAIHYGFNSTTILSKEMPILDEVCEKLKRNGKLGLELIGHTDNMGSEIYNQYLSERRAQAVANYLVKQRGIDPKRISVKGMGNKQPCASNKTTEGRELNRRTEFSFVEVSAGF